MPSPAPFPASLSWQPRGPRATKAGQVEGIQDKPVVGAIKAVAPHPADPDTVYIGSVNGGVWCTHDARAAMPHWQQLTDAEQSLSIGALAFDPTDNAHRTIVAGTGRFSSLRMGGALIGLLRSTDAGATWQTIDAGGLFRRFHICGVAPRGATIVVAANNGGICRTTNTGATWDLLSGAAASGLPAGFSFALASDPANDSRLFAHNGGGIFCSTDTGATWTKVSNAAIDGLLEPAAGNVKIAVGMQDDVYVAIANSGSGQLAGLFRSGDAGATWDALDLPSTVEAGGVVFGIHPGHQAGIHMSLAADPRNARVAYIGGDRQVGSDEAVGAAPRWPNAVGATDYSGRIFRVDAGQPPGMQATHVTHSNTASGSAPHADSRDMAFDASGDLLETDDGGIYRRTKPALNNGDWLSMIGDLQATEFHSAAWDPATRTLIGGAQDTGTPQQLAQTDSAWTSVSTGDGGAVLAGPAAAGFSTRYSSYYNLGDFRREVYDAAGALQSRTSVSLVVLAGGAALAPYFYTPIELNQANPTRLVIGAQNSVYESDDQGDTITEIGPGIAVNEALPTTYASPIAYGVAANPDLLYVGSGRDVYVRTAAPPAALVASATYPRTGPVVGIAIPPAEPRTAYVVEALKVYRTPDNGVSWSDITGGLLALGGTVVHAVVYCADLAGGSVVVGTNSGVYAAAAPGFNWSRLGSDLPNVPVLRLKYLTADRILLAGTLGRGAWTLDIPAPATV